MFNISKDFAPPFKMIEPFFKFGAIAYLLSIFALLFIDSSGDIFDLKVVGWAHLFLLGFVMIVIFGAMAQLIPVALEIGHFSVDLYYVIFPSLSVGAILMVVGFWFVPILLPYGGLLVLVSMLVFLYETLMTLKATTANTLTVKCVKAGNIFLTIAIAIGFLMALAIAQGLSLDLTKFLPIHIVLVLVGYVTITVIGLSIILLPMFGLAHGFDDSDINLAFKILVASVSAFSLLKLVGLDFLANVSLAAMAVGVALYLKQILTLYKIRARKLHDIWYKHIYVAFIALAIASVFLLIWLVSGSDVFLKSGIWLFLMGFFTFVINGHLIKIIPFLVWFERFSSLVGKKKVPMLHEMLPNRDINFSFWLSFGGMSVSAVGLLFSSDTLFKGGVTILALGAIFMVRTVIFILNFKPEED
jgi:hypothetical protein